MAFDKPFTIEELDKEIRFSEPDQSLQSVQELDEAIGFNRIPETSRELLLGTDVVDRDVAPETTTFGQELASDARQSFIEPLKNIGGAIKDAFTPDDDLSFGERVKARAVDLGKGIGTVAGVVPSLIFNNLEEVPKFRPLNRGNITGFTAEAEAGLGIDFQGVGETFQPLFEFALFPLTATNLALQHDLAAVKGDTKKQQKVKRGIINLLKLKPQEADVGRTVDTFREVGITDDNLERIFTPIVGHGFIKQMEFSEKAALLVGIFVGIPQLNKFLIGLTKSKSPAVFLDRAAEKQFAAREKVRKGTEALRKRAEGFAGKGTVGKLKEPLPKEPTPKKGLPAPQKLLDKGKRVRRKPKVDKVTKQQAGELARLAETKKLRAKDEAHIEADRKGFKKEFNDILKRAKASNENVDRVNKELRKLVDAHAKKEDAAVIKLIRQAEKEQRAIDKKPPSVGGVGAEFANVEAFKRRIRDQKSVLPIVEAHINKLRKAKNAKISEEIVAKRDADLEKRGLLEVDPRGIIDDILTNISLGLTQLGGKVTTKGVLDIIRNPDLGNTTQFGVKKFQMTPKEKAAYLRLHDNQVLATSKEFGTLPFEVMFDNNTLAAGLAPNATAVRAWISKQLGEPIVKPITRKTSGITHEPPFPVGKQIPKEILDDIIRATDDIPKQASAREFLSVAEGYVRRASKKGHVIEPTDRFGEPLAKRVLVPSGKLILRGMRTSLTDLGFRGITSKKELIDTLELDSFGRFFTFPALTNKEKAAFIKLLEIGNTRALIQPFGKRADIVRDWADKQLPKLKERRSVEEIRAEIELKIKGLEGRVLFKNTDKEFIEVPEERLRTDKRFTAKQTPSTIDADNNITKKYSGLNPIQFLPKKARTLVQEFFTPFSTLPMGEQILKARSKAHGDAARSEKMLGKLSKRINTHALEVRKDIFRFLDGQTDISTVAPEARILAKSIRSASDRIGQMLVKRGMLDQKAFEALKGKYVHYVYAINIIGDANIDPTRILKSNGTLDMGYLISRNKNLTAEDREALGLINDAGVAVPLGMGKALFDIAKFDYLATVADPKWGVVLPESTVKIRDKKGNIKVWGIGRLEAEIGRQAKVVQNNAKNNIVSKPATDRLETLEEALNALEERIGTIPKGFIQIPKSIKWGNLSGVMIRREVFNDIMPLARPLGNLGRIGNALMKFETETVALFKAGKVALNPPTVFRNVVSNFMQNNMRGRPIGLIAKDALAASKETLKALKGESAEWTTAKRAGLFQSSWTVAEIGEVIAALDKVNPNLWESFLSAVADMSKFYGKVDDLAKFTIYLQLRKSGNLNKWGIGDGKPVAVEDAVVEAMKWGMDYTLSSRSVKHLTRQIIPFGKYQYKIAPLIIESLSKRPWVIMKYMLLLGIGTAGVKGLLSGEDDEDETFSLAQEMIKRWEGMSEKEWKTMYRQLGSYVKQNRTFTPIPWKSKEGLIQWVNLEYYMPWGNWYTILRDMRGGDVNATLKSIGITNPFLEVVKAFTTGKNPIDPWTGTPIFSELDDPFTKLDKTLGWLSNRVMPSVFENSAVPSATHQGAIGSANRFIQGEVKGQPFVDAYGDTLTIDQVIGRWFGFNIFTANPKKAAVRIKARVNALTKELISQTIKANVILDKEKRTSRKEELKEQFRKEVKKLSQGR